MSISIEVGATDAVGTKVSLVILIPGGTSPPPTTSLWQVLKTGAGGFLRTMQVATDGSLATLADTYGAWVWDANAASPGNAGGLGAWYQAVTPTSIPSSDPTADLTFRLATWSILGVYGFAIAPSSSSTIYMNYLGYMFKSTDKGKTWTRLTNFTPVTPSDANPNVGPGIPGTENGPKMVVHPTNPNICFIGFQSTQGCWKTTDGGTTWTQISTASIANCTDSNGIFFVFDPNTPAHMFAASGGIGCYKSTDTGATWTKISGSGTSLTTLTNFHSINVDPQGNLWALDYGSVGNGSNNVNKYNGTTWTSGATILGAFNNNGNPYHWIAFDPLNTSPQRILIGDATMVLTQSTDGGTTWFGAFQNVFGDINKSATDIPYLGNDPQSDRPSLGSLHFIPGTSRLIASSGVGIWTITPSTSSGVACNWTSQSAGIEQLVANRVIGPPGSLPLVCCWDRSIFKIVDFNLYPTTYQPATFVSVPGGADLDYASNNSSFIAGGTADNNLNFSSNAGTSWSTKGGFPNTGQGFCSIAVLNSSVILAAQENGNLQTTTDGGTTWTDKGTYFNTNFGIAPGGTGWAGTSPSDDHHMVAADRNDTVSLYAFNKNFGASGGGLYRSQDNGATWTKRSANGGVNAIPEDGSGTQGGRIQMMSVPGHSGHLLFTGGPFFGDPHPQANPMYKSTDGGATWSDVNSQVREVWAFGVGATIGTYPRIAIWGWVNNVPGVFVSDNQGSTWTKIGEQTLYGTWDLVKTMAVDGTTGNVYAGMIGSGFARYSGP